MAAILSFFLLTNVFRCIKIVMGDYFKKVPVGMYLSELKFMLTHLFTQKQFGKCKDRQQWIVHLAIMTGYSAIFLMVVVFVNGLPLGIDWLKFQRGWASLGGNDRVFDLPPDPADRLLCHIRHHVRHYIRADRTSQEK